MFHVNNVKNYIDREEFIGSVTVATVEKVLLLLD